MRKNKKVLIYLAELAHDGFGLSLRTFPLGLGVVGSYVVSQFPSDVRVSMFRTYTDLMDAISTEEPDIVGFGYFSWNDYLTLVATTEVRKRCPNCLIVFGGSNISPYGQEKTSGFPIGISDSQGVKRIRVSPLELTDKLVWPIYNDYELLRNYPQVDIIIHGDGEIPMKDIVYRYLESGNRQDIVAAGIAGCTSLLENTIIRGPEPQILFDLDLIPSPYASGIFKNFMDRYSLLPQIETTRGCPYKCTFCTVGLNEGKLRKHSFDYTKQEILYLKDHYKNTVLRIADPNWGMLKKDVELANFIYKLRRDTGYPSSLRVYYSAGGPFENIKKMSILMKELLPLNMSFQSLNKDTLKLIKRGNMPLSKVEEMVEHARENGIATGTELISGLPKESLSSFKDSFLTGVLLRLDSIYMGALYLIKGSELFTPESRRNFGFRTKFALIERDATLIDGRWVFEMDELVVEHNEMTEEDFFELYRFKLWAQITYGAGYVKEMLFHCLNYGVDPVEIYDELVSSPLDYKFHDKLFSEYLEAIRPLFFDSPEELSEELTRYIECHGNVDFFYWNRHLQLAQFKVLGVMAKDEFIYELANAASEVYRRKAGNSGVTDSDTNYFAILEELREIQSKVIISPLESCEESIEIIFGYDLLLWARENYNTPLNHYRLSEPKNFNLRTRNHPEHLKFFEATRSFTSDAEKADYYYAVMVSSNMRRYITSGDIDSTETALVAADPVHPMLNV